jgi:hypothetical protein
MNAEQKYPTREWEERFRGENSMSIQDVSAEELAKLFYHYQGALAHDFNCRGDKETSEPASSSPSFSSSLSTWDHTPPQQRKLMVAAARLALLELATASQSGENHEYSAKPYFAKPGEADWGC